MNERITRRELLATLAKATLSGIVLGAVSPAAALAQSAPGLVVYKDPSCGCCTKWVEHLQAGRMRPVVH